MPRILVIEDSPTQARQLAFILEDAGFEIELARDAEQGLERLRDGRFDLVATDLHLPGDSGFDLCRRLRASPEYRHLPVVVLTAQADPVQLLRGLEAGADTCLSKERYPADIVRCLRHALDRGPYPAAPGEPASVVFHDQPFVLTASREQLLDVLVAALAEITHLNQRLQEEKGQRHRLEAELLAAPATAGKSTGLPPAPRTVEAVVDWKAARERADGSEELLRELVGLFLAEWPAWIRQLGQALVDRDAVTVRRVAHTVKGSLTTLGARTAAAAAGELEALSRSGDLAGCATASAALRTALEELQPVLSQFLAAGPSTGTLPVSPGG